MLLLYCAEDIHAVQQSVCTEHAQQNRLGSLLCTATIGFSGNFRGTLGLWPPETASTVQVQRILSSTSLALLRCLDAL